MVDVEHGNAIYPWDAWSDGKWKRKKQGKHFSCSVAGFRGYVLIAAGRRGLKAETRVKGDTVHFRIWDPAKEAK